MPTKVESDSVDESTSFALIVFSFIFSFFLGYAFLGPGVKVHFFSSAEGTQMGIWHGFIAS